MGPSSEQIFLVTKHTSCPVRNEHYKLNDARHKYILIQMCCKIMLPNCKHRHLYRYLLAIITFVMYLLML